MKTSTILLAVLLAVVSCGSTWILLGAHRQRQYHQAEIRGWKWEHHMHVMYEQELLAEIERLRASSGRQGDAPAP